jgi:DNA invertase Pin-like site-specific DNA recombinase
MSFSERGIGIRNLADPIEIDSCLPDDPIAQLAVVLLALVAQMERTYTMERAAHARAVAIAKGRRVGRPVLVSSAQIEWAAHLRENGHTIAEIVEKTRIPRTSLYRHLLPTPRASGHRSRLRGARSLEERASHTPTGTGGSRRRSRTAFRDNRLSGHRRPLDLPSLTL